MLGKLKSYYIIISSAAIAILYFLLTLSRDKARHARNASEREKLSRELDKLRETSNDKERKANDSYKDYKRLLDKYPDLANKLKGD